MRRIGNGRRVDGLYRSLFSFLATDKLVAHLGGGFKFVNHANILESVKTPDRPYLRLGTDEAGLLSVNLRLEDEKGITFFEVIENKIEVSTEDVWDIEFERRYMQFIHKDQELYLKIRLRKNGELDITGRVFLNGGLFEITKREVTDVSHGSQFRDISKIFRGSTLASGRGLILAPGRLAI